MAERDESGQRGLSISANASTEHARLLGRVLKSLGVLLSDVGELVGGNLPLEMPPQPKPGDEFERDGKTYVVCDSYGCAPWVDSNKKQVWCYKWNAEHRCEEPCFCMLLRAKRYGGDKWVPDPGKPEKDPDGTEKYPADPDNFVYNCACVRPKT